MKSPPVGSLSPEFLLLGLLSQGAAHGYELHQRLDTDLSQVWHLSQSQVYNILNRLEAKGFISGILQEQEKLPSKRLFRLTEAGQRRFKGWLLEPSRSSLHVIRVEFTTRLYFAYSIDPQLAHNLIDSQINEIREGLQRLKKTRSSLPPERLFNQLGLDLRIRQLNSILDWLDACHVVLLNASHRGSRA